MRNSSAGGLKTKKKTRSWQACAGILLINNNIRKRCREESLIRLLGVTDADGQGNERPLEGSKYFKGTKCRKTPVSNLRTPAARRQTLGAEQHDASTFVSQA